MTNKECVSDLENIKSYFLENFEGTYPAGLDYAINMINSGDAVQYTLGYQDGFLEGKKICERPQGDLADEVWKLYEKYQPHLATCVIEFGDELKELLIKYMKGGAE